MYKMKTSSKWQVVCRQFRNNIKMILKKNGIFFDTFLDAPSWLRTPNLLRAFALFLYMIMSLNESS